MKYLLSIGLALSLGTSHVVFSSAASAEEPLSITNLTTPSGETVSVSKNKLLLVFWATWCTSCKDKLTHVLPDWNRQGDFAVVAVNTDEDERRAQHYIKKNELKVPVAFDKTKTLVRRLNVQGVPHWAFLERQGPSDPWKLVESAAAFDEQRVKKTIGFNGMIP